jgi:hypothetical protein
MLSYPLTDRFWLTCPRTRPWSAPLLKRDRDPDYAMLHITDIGRDAILGRQKLKGESLPPKP